MFGDEEEDYDCWDWFQQDKEKVLRCLQRKTRCDAHPNSSRNKCRFNKSGRINHKSRITDGDGVTLTNRALSEILNLPPLNMFLYIMTQKEPDFFVNQIKINDDKNRVLLYTRILVTVCELELPGFHAELLSKFSACETLLMHFENMVKKMFAKRYKTMWKDIEFVDNLLYYMQSLLLQSQKAAVLTEKGMHLLFTIWTLIKKNETPEITERAVCKQFCMQLERLFSVEEEVLAEKLIPDELYPTHKEILDWCSNANDDFKNVDLLIKYDNVHSYINSQKKNLRQNFLLPLKKQIRLFNKIRSIKEFDEPQIAFENVEIKLNKNFADARRYKLVFVDILGSKRAERNQKNLDLTRKERLLIESIKCGTLFCFTSNYDFEKIIFATASTTERKLLHSGYVAIIIVQQYNIGNIYDQPFIMFEAPSYFEPFAKAYNYLCNCNAINFPMAKYIVFGETKTKTPAYLQECQPAITYRDQKFMNKFKNLPLNESQRGAYLNSLANDFCLIQGLPGTGKTYLSLELLKTLMEYAKSYTPIVLITYTNESLDKFLLKLSEYTDSIVRFGCQARIPEIAKFNAYSDKNKHMINPNLKKLYWRVNMDFKEQFRKLQMLYKTFDGSDNHYQEILKCQREVWNDQQKLNSIRTIFQHYLVRKKRVIAMTTTCASRMNFIFRFLKSKIVIFEEAAEILEAHILPCLTPYTQHVIMIGDHKQLKPFTNTNYIKVFADINISLFERLLRGKFKASVLNEQYRMHRTIADLLCPIIYKDLQSNAIVDTYPDVRNMSKNVFFVTHHELEMQNHCAIHNDWELNKILILVRYLLEISLYTANDIVVLSPYSKQVDRIKLIFSKIPNMTNIVVATVDSFQGLEANIVLLSLVRSNKRRRIGFLNEQNRICVALSRARYGLYIIGNMDILTSASSVWRAINKKLQEKKAIGLEFPFEKSLSFM